MVETSPSSAEDVGPWVSLSPSAIREVLPLVSVPGCVQGRDSGALRGPGCPP